jgi:DNA-binding response OmpR family regulator
VNHRQVLVVENEQIVALDLEMFLGSMGYDVALATTGEGAVEAAGRLKPDVVLMDIRLDGDLDGIQAAERIRKESEIPVVFLTAYADHQTIERAARVDPSGYIVKPFNEKDLAAILHLALHRPRFQRRTMMGAPQISAEEAGGGDPPQDGGIRAVPVVRIGDLSIDSIHRRVLRRGTEIQLTKKEFDILECLAEHPGVPVSSETLLTRVWGPQFVHYIQTLRVHLGNLRQKIEGGDSSSGIRIEAVRGVGYRLIESGLTYLDRISQTN